MRMNLDHINMYIDLDMFMSYRHVPFKKVFFECIFGGLLSFLTYVFSIARLLQRISALQMNLNGIVEVMCTKKQIDLPTNATKSQGQKKKSVQYKGKTTR